MSIQHPDCIGAGNKHLLDNLAAAYRAGLDLAERGYHMVDIKVGERNPRILIEPSGRCRELHGAVRMVTGTGAGRKQTMVALHRGAQIEWEEPA